MSLVSGSVVLDRGMGKGTGFDKRLKNEKEFKNMAKMTSLLL